MRSIILFTFLALFVATANSQAPAELTKQVQAWAKQSETPQFKYGLVDLNDDGISDAIVLMRESDYCGSGGCFLLVFQGNRHGFKLISSSSISSTPIRVTQEKSYKWKTLVVHSNGTGNVQLKFNGSRYPLNPSMQPKATAEQIYSAKVLIQ